MRAQSAFVETTGQQIARRRKALGYDVAPFAREAKVSRQTLTDIEGGANFRDKTIRKIMHRLEELEAEVGLDVPTTAATESVVTFQAKGLFGVAEVSVAGPVEITDELAQKFADVITKIAREAGGQPNE